MFIKFPNFKSFNNFAICPSDSGKDEFHVIDGGKAVYFDFSKLMDGTATCVPYYPGHMYVLYKGKDTEDLCSYRFQTEVDLKKYLTLYYGTPHISGACLQNIPLILKGELPELLHFEDFTNSETNHSDLGQLHNSENSKTNSEHLDAGKMIDVASVAVYSAFRGQHLNFLSPPPT